MEDARLILYSSFSHYLEFPCTLYREGFGWGREDPHIQALPMPSFSSPGLLGRHEEQVRPLQVAPTWFPCCCFLLPPFLASLPGLVLFVFSFQIFLSYTESGSSFVFGEALVKDVFAFQVSLTLGSQSI